MHFGSLGFWDGGTTVDPNRNLIQTEDRQTVLSNEDSSVVIKESLYSYTDEDWLVTIPTEKLLYVSKTGNDSNDGSKNFPFKTIQKAYDNSYPGTCILVDEGIYYERACPPRSGRKDNYIMIKGRPGKQCILSGLNDPNIPVISSWTNSSISGCFQTTMLLDAQMSGSNYDDFYTISSNPFREQLRSSPYGVNGYWDYVNNVNITSYNPNIFYHCGQIFLKNRLNPLKEYPFLTVSTAIACSASVSLSLENNNIGYFVDSTNITGGVIIHIKDGTQTDINSREADYVQFTVRRTVWAPHILNLKYHWIEGMVFEKTGNQYPVNFWANNTTVHNGCVSFRAGYGFVFRRNTIRQAGTVGLDTGRQTDSGFSLERYPYNNQRLPIKKNLGNHIIEYSYFIDCGSTGATTYKDPNNIWRWNVFERNNKFFEFISSKRYENGGLKCVGSSNTLITNNLFRDMGPDADSLYIDGWDYGDTDIINNIFLRGLSNAIHIEFNYLTRRKVRIWNNFIYDFTGSAIYGNNSAGVSICHNFVDNLSYNNYSFYYVRQGLFTSRFDERGDTEISPSSSEEWEWYGNIVGNDITGLPCFYDRAYPIDMATGSYGDYNVYGGTENERMFLFNRFTTFPPVDDNTFLYPYIEADLSVMSPGPSAYDYGLRINLNANEARKVLLERGSTDYEQHSVFSSKLSCSVDHSSLFAIIDIDIPLNIGSKQDLNINKDLKGNIYKNDGTDKPGPFQELRPGYNKIQLWRGPRPVQHGNLPIWR